MKHVLICSLVALFFHTNGLYAQNNDSLSVLVIKRYKPGIAEANKLQDAPSLKDSSYINKKLDYSILNKLIDINYNVMPIKAATLKGWPVDKLYKSLVKIGIGTRNTYNGEFSINTVRNKNYSMGAEFKHLSSSGKIKDAGFAGYSDNGIKLYGKRFYPKNTISGNIFYDRNIIHYYGYDSRLFDMNHSDIKQHFDCVGANVKLEDSKIDSAKINTDLALSYYFLNDRYDAKEHNVSLKTNFNTFIKNELANAFVNLDIYNNNDTSTSTILNIRPQINSRWKFLRFNLGVDFFLASSDTVTHFNPYPNLNVSYSIVSNYIVAYAGLNGKTTKNTYKDITGINPFVNSLAPLDFTRNKINLFGGLRGNITTTASFNLRATYSDIENIPLFVIDTNYLTTSNILNPKDITYTVIYDNATLFNVYGELAYQQSEKLKLLLAANYNKYNMKNELKPWHKPELDITFSSIYNLKDKIIVRGDIYYVGERFSKYCYNGLSILDSTKAFQKLNSIVDVNLGLEYRYSKVLSAYINFYNIASSKYYIWNKFQSYQFTVMGGLTYMF